MQNLRAFTRTDFVGMVTLMGTERPHGDAVWGKDLSENGMFLQTTSPFRVGDTVQLHFTLKSGEVHVERAEVRWLRRFEPVNVDGTLPGIGVHFVQMSETSRAALRTFIDASVAAIPTRPVPEIAGTMRMFAAPGAPPDPVPSVGAPVPRSVSLAPTSSLICDAPTGTASVPPLTLLTAPPQASTARAEAPTSVPPVTAPYPKADAPMAANWQGWRFDRVKVAPTGPALSGEPPSPPTLDDDGASFAAEASAGALPKFEEATWDEPGGTLEAPVPDFVATAPPEMSVDALFDAFDDVTAPPHPAEESMPHPRSTPNPPSALADITVPNQPMRQRPVIVRSAEVPGREARPEHMSLDSHGPEENDVSTSGPAWSMGRMFGTSTASSPPSSSSISFPPLSRDAEDSAPYLVPESQAFPVAQAGDEMLTHSEIAALRPARRAGFWPKAAIVVVGAGLGVWMGVPGTSSDAPAASDEASPVVATASPQAVAEAERGLDEPAPRSRLQATLEKAAAPEVVPTAPAAGTAPVAIAAPVHLASAPAPATTADKATPVRQATTLASAAPRPSAGASHRGERIVTAPGSATVDLEGGDIVSVFGLENPARVVVDLEGAKYPGPIQEAVGAHGVKQLRIGKPDKSRIRVVVELEGEARPRGIMADKSTGELSVRWR